MNQVGSFLLLAPRNVCVAFLSTYRKVISPLYGDVCRYYPSCSHYALQAIQQHGVVKGVGLGTWRLIRCNPWSEGGVDDVPIPRRQKYELTSFGFVTAQSPGKA